MRLAGLSAGACAIALALAAACAGADRGPPRSATCDLGGTWAGTATDPAGTAWDVVLVLHQDAATVAGTLEFTSASGTRAVEDVRGTVTCKTGVVTLRAGTADAPAYQLTLSADDRALSGSWGDNDHPGTISATRR